jgi:DNA-binding transcriptional LysR family regulator
MKQLHKFDRIALALALLALILVIGDLILQQPGLASAARIGDSQPVSLILAGDWTNTTDLQALDQLLADFHALYPHITVETRMTDVRSGPGSAWYSNAHVVIRGGPPPAEGSPFVEAPVAWTGQLWVLAARQDHLAEAAERFPAEVGRLRSGLALPADFEALLQDAQAAGLSPITLGNSHKWPFMMWLQHWVAAAIGPAQASVLLAPPAGWNRADPEAIDPWATIRSAYNDLLRWKDNGWFYDTVWNEGWAKGLGPLVEGRATFALVSAAQLSALPPLVRESLEYLPFPRSSGQPSWTIGSASFIGLGMGTHPMAGDASTTKASKKNLDRETAAARLLVRFLSSPGVTARLSSLTGKPFFAWDSTTGSSPQVLAAWADAALTPAYEAMARELDPGRH